MKKNSIRLITLTVFTVYMALSMTFSGFADIISDSPYETEGSTAEETVKTQENGSVYYAPKQQNTDKSSTSNSGNSSSYLILGDTSDEGTSSGKDTLELGFTVVSPAYPYNGKRVAEGRIQLKNGNFVTIDHDYYLRDPYYKFIREETDSEGTQWLVVTAHASFLGNFHTPGKNVVSELWLKKAECSATDTLNLDLSNETRGEIVKTALSLLGKQYKRAGNGPEKFDCSGFVNYVFEQCGVSVPRNSTEICSMSGKVDISELQPGDICAKKGHVGIYVGNDRFVHACDTANGVVSEILSAYNEKNGFKYYINVFGD